MKDTRDQSVTVTHSATNLRHEIATSGFLDGMFAGVMLHGRDGSVLELNEAARRIFGDLELENDTLVRVNREWRIVREDGSAYQDDELPLAIALRTGAPIYNEIMGIDRPHQPRRWIYTDVWPLVVDERVTGAISIFDDYSTRWAERHVLRLLSAVSRLVLLATSENECLQQLCDVLVEQGGYALAWVASPSPDDPIEIDVVCVAGESDYVFKGMVSLSESHETGLGPVGTALRTGVTQVVNDLPNDSLFQPWRDRAARFALESCVAIPISIGDGPATLNIYHQRIGAFDELAIQGLEQIAREVEFALAHVRSMRQSERALRKTITAIRAQVAAEHHRTEIEERFRLAFEENMAPMTFTDTSDRILAVNDAFCDMVGFEREELLGHDSTLFTYPEDIGITEESLRQAIMGEAGKARYVKRYQRKDGRVIVVEVARSSACDADGNTLYFVFSERDVTEERALTDQLSHQALHDPLTGLANRVLFEDRLARARAHVTRTGGLGAVLLVDLDDFKGVNDAHGHIVGDQLLSEVARRMEQVTRSSDTLSRFGGDEFLYLAEGLTSEGDAREIAERLLSAMGEPFMIADSQLVQHASVGVVVWDERNSNSSDLIQSADIALYEAKRQGKGSVALFAPIMHHQAVSRFTLIQELRSAFENRELTMHYQPIVELTTSTIVGFEALMRWQHSSRGAIAPDVFIALAEESDLIVQLGWFALDEAVFNAANWRWSEDREPGPYVSVNLSSRQFYHQHLLKKIDETLDAHRLSPDRLILEITESVTLSHSTETVTIMRELSKRGIGIALDDFGTGYSSLSYLIDLHPRIIKIDKTFVSQATKNWRSDTLLESIISLGKKLKCAVLAEGIETKEQLNRLREFKCEFGQGFHFSQPIAGSEVHGLLATGFTANFDNP
ncbi:MAG TPA: EAL domain-containing protein [Acidimicrobiales bacterium]|nr:EAL domain-containing protein [Acidimicrobiales bacterium]